MPNFVAVLLIRIGSSLIGRIQFTGLEKGRILYRDAFCGIAIPPGKQLAKMGILGNLADDVELPADIAGFIEGVAPHADKPNGLNRRDWREG